MPFAERGFTVWDVALQNDANALCARPATRVFAEFVRRRNFKGFEGDFRAHFDLVARQDLDQLVVGQFLVQVRVHMALQSVQSARFDQSFGGDLSVIFCFVN